MKMKDIWWTMFWLILVGNAIAWIVIGISANERGKYGGAHYGDARGYAIDEMSLRYGAIIADNLRLADPPVKNTHMHNSVLFGNGQVRIFHFIGPKGVRYCVPVNNGVDDWRAANAIVKGCRFH